MIDFNRITTALLLAAGTGSRLRPLTRNAPKCLTEVGDRPILDRLIHNLRAKGFQRLVVVLGHQGDQIRDFLRHKADDMRVEGRLCFQSRVSNHQQPLFPVAGPAADSGTVPAGRK